MANLIADVCHIEDRIAEQFMLHAQTILVDGRDLVVTRPATYVPRREQDTAGAKERAEVPVEQLRIELVGRVEVRLTNEVTVARNHVLHDSGVPAQRRLSIAEQIIGKTEARS